MQIALLGPLEVRAGSGAPVEVGGARLRTLLIRLALDPGRVVTTGALVDALWGDDPPAGAANALQALVSRLRRILPEGAVESTPAGYRLAVPPEAVDACRFEREVTAGRARLATDPAGAAEVLAGALALWRGPALADVAEAGFARAPAARLTELRLAATEDRVDAALALGDGAGLVPELESLSLAHPLRERLAGQLMRVLRDAGRPAEALAAYDRLRGALADSLGTDPAPDLAALHLSILRKPPVLKDAPPAAALPVTNLPATLTTFVGRDDDVTKVTKVVAESRLTTLIGPGGAGKTRLAMETGRALLDQAPDGVWLVEFAPVTDASELASVVLATLGLREHPLVSGMGRVPQDSADPLTRLRGALGGRRSLLILDNCEHLVGAAAALAESLLVHCPHLRVLTTSREPLGITGEALFPVEPLALPPDGAGAADALAYPAVRLFADRAAAARPGFAVTDAVVRICRALDGMPLAIELAAARLRALTPEQVADRLTDRFRLLNAGSRTALPRHQTLRAVIDWSWELLDDAERALWRRLAVFSGPATLEAVEAVCAGQPGTDVLDQLAALVDKSLVVAGQDGRYRMLETIKAYGLERLEQAGGTDAARRAHARYFLRLARHADRHLRGRDQLEWLGRIEADRDNLHAAARWAIAAGDAPLAVGFAAALGWYWWMGGRRAEGAELALGALALPGRVSRTLTAMATSLAALNVVAGLFDLEHGQRLLREGAELARGYEDRHPSLSLIGPISRLFADPPGDEHALPDVARLFDNPDPWVRGVARVLYGHSESNLGRADRDPERHFTAALAEFDTLGDRWGIATTLAGMAHLTSADGDHVRAAGYFERSLAELEPLGATEDIPETQARYAYELWMTGESERAFATLEEARRTAERVGTDEGRAAVAYHHGEILRATGEFERARAALTEAESVAVRYDSAYQWVALIRSALAQVDAAEGDLAAAWSRLDGALALALRSRDMPVVGLVLMAHADAALHSGDPDQAARFAGAAYAVRGGPDRSTVDARRIDSTARERLGEERFAEAFEQGRLGTTPATVRESVRLIRGA